MNRNDNKNSRRTSNYNKNSRGNRKRGKRGKEVEVDIQRDDINKADLRGIDPKINDASWYNKVPELVMDAANIYTSQVLGNAINDFTTDRNVKRYANTVAGLMVIDIVPTIGGTTSGATSPINVAAKQIYSFLRYANSGSRNYQPNDVMLYIVAMDSAFALYSNLVRAYGLIRNFSIFNRYTPETFLNALGFDYSDLSSDMARFRSIINTFAFKLGSLCVPNDMSYVMRHAWLFSGLFGDSESVKSQTYAFKQAGYYIRTVGTTTGNYLQYKEWPSTPVNLNAIQTMVNNIMTPLTVSEDVGLMSGDIWKAFGQENLYAVAPIDDNYMVQPYYSLEVLSQIQNLTITPTSNYNQTIKVNVGSSTVTEVGMNIVQSTPTANYSTYLTQSVFTAATHSNSQNAMSAPFVEWRTMMDNKVMTMYKDSLTPDDIMVATRLVNLSRRYGTSGLFATGTIGSNTDAAYIMYSSNIGTELVKALTIYQYNYENGSDSVPTVQTYSFNSNAILITDSNEVQTINSLAALSQFDYHPELVVLTSTSASGPAPMAVFQDVNNYFTLQYNELRRMHEAAVYSEFYVPVVNKLSQKPFR